MTDAAVENAICENCGVDVRENTSYCYNCGVPVNGPEAEEPSREKIDPKTKAALDDLAAKLRNSEEEDKKLEKAAAERRKARVKQRKPKEFVWEPDHETGLPLLVATLLIALFAGIVVMFTVFWK